MNNKKSGGRVLSSIQDYMIHRFIKERNGKTTLEEIIKALSKSEEDKQLITEKIRMMERFGMLTVKGNTVAIK